MGKYICTLEERECTFKGDNDTCLIDKTGCGFRKKEEDEQPKQINEKPKKWFEKYMRY